MARRPASGPEGCGLLIVGLLAIGLAVLIIKWALITAAILAVPFGAWWIYDQTQQRKAARHVLAFSTRRSEIESRAVIDASGGCGWCGSRIAHRNDYTGSIMQPAEYHREEIDRAVAG